MRIQYQILVYSTRCVGSWPFCVAVWGDVLVAGDLGAFEGGAHLPEAGVCRLYT